MQRESEVIQEGMIPYCGKSKAWGFIHIMPMRFLGFYFIAKRYQMFHVKQWKKC